MACYRDSFTLSYQGHKKNCGNTLKVFLENYSAWTGWMQKVETNYSEGHQSQLKFNGNILFFYRINPAT
jgi:hypothetical protein